MDSEGADADAIRARRITWRPSHRVVPSRFPPVGLFDRVADPADLEALYAIEALTNDRIRDQAGNLALVPAEERISGPGTTPIMPALSTPLLFALRLQRTASRIPKPMRKSPAIASSVRDMSGLARTRSARKCVSSTAAAPYANVSSAMVTAMKPNVVIP